MRSTSWASVKMSAASRWLASVGFSQAATESPALGDWATRLSSQRSASSWRAIRRARRRSRCVCAAVLGLVGGDLVGLALVFQTMRLSEGFQARELEVTGRRCGWRRCAPDAPCRTGPGASRRGELVADPGNRGAHGALVGGLAFDAEVSLPAVPGIEALDHRAHEGEVADVKLALARGADPCLAAP
jgi:hypothetical protein